MKLLKSRWFTGCITAVGTVLLPWWAKTLYAGQVQNNQRLFIVTIYTLSFVIMIVCFASLDKLLARMWNSSVAVRRTLDAVEDRPFLEGVWVDVGIDTSGKHNRVVNYSSITISRKDDNYAVHGVSWQYNSSDPDGSVWDSEHCELSGDRLTFWYSGKLKGTSSEIDYGKAEYRFFKDNPGTPITFVGRYGDHSFETRGKFHHLTQGKEEKIPAELYLSEYRRKNYYDEEGLQVPQHRGSHPAQRQWYRTFVRRSDKEQQESLLLHDLLDSLSSESLATILDVGPGEGRLTRSALEMLRERNRLATQHSYLAVDPSGAHLDSIESTLSPLLGDSSLLLVKEKIERFLPTLHDRKFDIIFLLNVLYFIPSAGDFVKQIGQLLAPNGLLVALHTDFSRSDFLKQMIGSANSTLQLDVVNKIAGLGDGADFIYIGDVKGKVSLRFPEISDAFWNEIESDPDRYADSDVSDTVDLLCFLVDKDVEPMQKQGAWKPFVHGVRDHLRRNRTVDMPITAQLIRRNR